MKQIKFLTVAALAFCALTGCSKEEGPEVPLYQQYEVFIDNGAKSAFANLRLGDANGERQRLGSGSTLLCNTQTMFYSAVGEEYNYSTALDPKHNKAKFQLIYSTGQTFRNEVDLSDLPNITFSSTSEDLAARKVMLDLDGADLRDVTAYVYVSSITSSDEDDQSKQVLPVSATGEVDTQALDNARYEIYVDYVKNHPTVENDRGAKGNIKVVKRIRKLVDFRDSASENE